MSRQSQSQSNRLPHWIDQGALRRLSILLGLLVVVSSWVWGTMIQMPGKSFQGPLPSLTTHGITLQATLNRDLERLAAIGPRNSGFYENLEQTQAFLSDELTAMGYEVTRQIYTVEEKVYTNLVVEQRGHTHPNEIVIVGAHYDSAFTAPGLNDNGSGAVAVLEMARLLQGQASDRTLRFVEFTNEEPPFFSTPNMGSARYAALLKQNGAKVVAMLSLDEIGYFTDAPNSQHYPPPFHLLYPNRGNFISFVGNVKSRYLLRNAIATFRHQTQFPSEGLVAPEWVTGISWSDHGSFWHQGYPAIMVTDTAPFRYPYYHTFDDTLDKVNVEHLARVTQGLVRVVQQLARSQ